MASNKRALTLTGRFSGDRGRAKVLSIVKRIAPQSVIDRLIGGLVASAMKQPA